MFSKSLVWVYRLQHLTFPRKGVLKLETSASHSFIEGEPGSQKGMFLYGTNQSADPQDTVATKSHLFTVEKLENMSNGKKVNYLKSYPRSSTTEILPDIVPYKYIFP